MVKRVLITVMCLLLLVTLGCATTSETKEPSSHEILRKAVVGISPKWQMYQIRVNLPGGAEFPVLLKLADGDRVDVYFYLEKGVSVDFRINAASLLYTSQNPSGKVTSDRFTFTASQGQGNTYIMTLRNTATSEKDIDEVFFEVMYPASGSMFITLETK